MRCALLFLIAALGASAQTVRYELRGRLLPATAASVWLDAATTPFEESTVADDEGRFRFQGIQPGTYTLSALVPARGEMHRTIEIGPAEADARNRVVLTIQLRDEDFESRDGEASGDLVSVQELAIPQKARREYDEAEKKLAVRDVAGAVTHLERAVKLAPRYAEAWNHLGTIAYQTHDFPRAESCFRKALAAQPGFFQPIVNLGGVLINLKKFDESLQFNLAAVRSRPNDALANSQLGMSYFFLDKLDRASKYLTIAQRLDPAHFSHPQLMLAQIDLRQGNRAAAADELQQFLQYHPDSPQAGKIKQDIAKLRAPPGPAEALAATGMGRSFSETPDLPLYNGDRFSVLRKNGRLYLESRDTAGQVHLSTIDATIGSGRHARVLLSRTAGGGLTELPLAWYAEGGGRYASALGFGFSTQCLDCHAVRQDSHLEAIGCQSCHRPDGAPRPAQAVCLRCHVAAAGTNSAHGPGSENQEEKFELNSAAYRLFESRCYRASAGKLTCASCHPAHTFSKTLAGYRMVCRGCHPTMHEGAPLNCTRCHMPKRKAQDAPQIMVTDHRIQRPL